MQILFIFNKQQALDHRYGTFLKTFRGNNEVNYYIMRSQNENQDLRRCYPVSFCQHRSVYSHHSVQGPPAASPQDKGNHSEQPYRSAGAVRRPSSKQQTDLSCLLHLLSEALLRSEL